MNQHKCHAIGCFKHTNPKLLMCPAHWTLVPTTLQVAVRDHYDPKQCDGTARPSREWIDAARAAITYIAKHEGKL